MCEKLMDIVGALPFVLLVDGHILVNKTRIIESFIYAIAGGLFSGYVAVKVIGEIRGI